MANQTSDQPHASNWKNSSTGFVPPTDNPPLLDAIAALGTDYRRAEVSAQVAIGLELNRLNALLQRVYAEDHRLVD